MPFTPAYPFSPGAQAGRIRNPSLRSALAHVQAALARKLGAATDNGDGYPAYVEAARRAGVDVNDWIESQLGWIPARPVLDQLVMPLLQPHFTVCEVGIGTGRWSRHLAQAIPGGNLILVDRSAWIVDFASGYFASSPNVTAVRGDGLRLPFGDDEWGDLFFSQGMFITLRLGHLLAYLREFARCLRPGGRAVFDFIDPGTPEGWNFLQAESRRAPDVFAYHRLETVSRCCDDAGLRVEKTLPVGKSTYVVAERV